MQHGIADDDMRASARKFTIQLMQRPLRAAGIDLTDMDAVREALIAARFGDELIAACAEQAAMEPAYA